MSNMLRCKTIPKEVGPTWPIAATSHQSSYPFPKFVCFCWAHSFMVFGASDPSIKQNGKAFSRAHVRSYQRNNTSKKVKNASQLTPCNHQQAKNKRPKGHGKKLRRSFFNTQQKHHKEDQRESEQQRGAPPRGGGGPGRFFGSDLR